MLQAARYVSVGGGLTLAALAAAVGANVLFGLGWLLVAVIALVVVGAVALALTFTPAPADSGAGSWSQFASARGDGFNVVGSAFFGGRAGAGQQSTEWNTRAVINSALPLLAAAGLLVYWFLP